MPETENEQFYDFCALCESDLSGWCTFQNTKQSYHLIKKKNWSGYKLKSKRSK